MPSLRSPKSHPELSGLDRGLLEAVVAGEARLTPAQGLEVYREMPTPELGRWADARCRALHGETIRTYVIDRNINYTNVCTARVHVLRLPARRDDHDAYTLEYEELLEQDRGAGRDRRDADPDAGGDEPEPAAGLVSGSCWLRSRNAIPGGTRPRVQPAGVDRVRELLRPARRLDSLRRSGGCWRSCWRRGWTLCPVAAGRSSPPGASEDRARQVRREAWLTTMYAAH
jgi:hypothetical protein